MGAYNVLYMIEREDFPASFRQMLLTSYFAGLFRSVRFGVSESHGKGAALQINRYIEAGAASFDGKTGRFKIDFPARKSDQRSHARPRHGSARGRQGEGERHARQVRHHVGADEAGARVGHLGPRRSAPIYPAAGEK